MMVTTGYETLEKGERERDRERERERWLIYENNVIPARLVTSVCV